MMCDSSDIMKHIILELKIFQTKLYTYTYCTKFLNVLNEQKNMRVGHRILLKRIFLNKMVNFFEMKIPS